MAWPIPNHLPVILCFIVYVIIHYYEAPDVNFLTSKRILSETVR